MSISSDFGDISVISTSIAAATGLWGTILNFSRRNIKANIWQKVWVFCYDMLVNIGLTMLVYIGMKGYGFNDMLSVAVAGFLGHQGTRSIYLLELIVAEKLGAKETFNHIKEDRGEK